MPNSLCGVALKIPKHLRPKDKQILSWEQPRAVLANATRRDRLLLMLDMTDALQPSELFAIRRRTFDNENTRDLTEPSTEARSDPSPTPKSLSKMRLPDDLAAELKQWKLKCPDPSPDAFMFPERGRTLHGHLQLPQQSLKPLADALSIQKLNFQVIRRTIATRAQSLGSVKDIQSHLRHSRADTAANGYMQELPESVQQMVGTVLAMLTAEERPQRVN